MKPLNEQPLFPRDLLKRRMGRMILNRGQPSGFRTVATLFDVSKWIGCSYFLLKKLENGTLPITDEMQVKLSQFFYLVDMGMIVIKVDGRKKTWVRVTPETPPCKSPMPRIDFAAGRITFD